MPHSMSCGGVQQPMSVWSRGADWSPQRRGRPRRRRGDPWTRAASADWMTEPGLMAGRAEFLVQRIVSQVQAAVQAGVEDAVSADDVPRSRWL